MKNNKTSSSAAPLTKSNYKYRSKLRNRPVEINYQFPIPREFQKQLKEMKMRSNKGTVRISAIQSKQQCLTIVHPMLNSAIYCGRRCKFAVDFGHRLPEFQNRLPGRTSQILPLSILRTVVESRKEDKATKLPVLGSHFFTLRTKNSTSIKKFSMIFLYAILKQQKFLS